jgi:hypothetical protein
MQLSPGPHLSPSSPKLSILLVATLNWFRLIVFISTFLMSIVNRFEKDAVSPTFKCMAEMSTVHAQSEAKARKWNYFAWTKLHYFAWIIPYKK